jgi:integrase
MQESRATRRTWGRTADADDLSCREDLQAMKRRKRRQGTGTISQLPSGNWRGRLRYIDPTTDLPERITVSGKTQYEVLDKLREVQNRLAQGRPARDSGNILRSFLAEHFDLLEKELKASTVHNYRAIANSTILPALGDKRLNQLSPQVIQRAFAGEGKERSRVLAMNVLSGAMNRAVRWRLIAENPCTGLRRPRPKSRAGQVHYWTQEEARRFLEFASDHQNYALFRIALSAGMRKGELLGLQWRDVDFQRGILFVSRRVDQRTGAIDTPKTNTGRAIELAQDDLALLRSLREKTKSLHVLATPATGIVPREIANSFDRLIGRYNAEARLSGTPPLPRITFHDLRHTCATLLISAGIPIKVVAERLGHKDITITLRTYGHVLPAMQGEAARAISAMLASGT